MFCCDLLEVCSFLIRDENRVGQKGEARRKELRGAERQEAVISIHCIKSKPFSIKGRKKKKRIRNLQFS